MDLKENIQYRAKTLVDLLRWRADYQPDKLAFMYLQDGEKEAGSFTYKQLDIRAKAIAAEFQSQDLKNERALLIYESGLDYLDSFFGCLYAGVISVPLHLPGKNKSLSRISSIAKDSGAKVILSTQEIQNELEKEFAKDSVLKNLKWISTENINNNLSIYWKETGIKDETLAYLQYTSGSTGIPKGVMVNHRNLIHNINIIDKCHPHDENSVMVTWLPIHHDMGLVYGMLLPFVCGYPCYFMTPQAFVQKPFRWLNAISKYKGTHNAAPNFAYELCVNKITDEQKKSLDLSGWTTTMNAAEPVRAETIQRFSEYFKDCGFKQKYFSPGYGLAEGTLILSTTFKSDEPVMKRFDNSGIEKNNKAVDANKNDTDSKVHVGHSNSIEDTRIAIVNPVTHIECKEGEVGEVWASGISIAQGYWQRDDATTETFKAHITDTNEGPFLRTGDLGFLKDNQLFITGRHKDLIIIRGQNHYPQDIEYTIEASHPALRLGCVAAFSMEVEGEEHLGIVQEVQKNFVNDFNAEEVIKAILKSVSEEHDLQVYSVSLIQPGTVPKTSSGKIQRRACRNGIQDGTLSVIVKWTKAEMVDFRSKVLNLDKKTTYYKKENVLQKNFIQTKNNLREWIVVRLAEMMQIKKDFIDVNEPFASYGMDSLKAVQLSGDLETLLDKELPSTLVYDYPTINLLTNYLTTDSSDSSDLSDYKKSKVENEPIAIVGIGLRFPDANNVNEFWNNLINGKDSIRKIPEGRWRKDLLKNSTITYGGFVDDVDKFDPVFFGISPREAIQIDPQQRFALEVTWEALEDAGINPETLAGTNTGVFMGICTYDYSRFSSGKKDLFDVYTGTGTSLSIAANRISYNFDFRGLSIAIDTACSSSLVALHTACQSLRSGQSDIALAGGVNLLLAPDWNVVFTEADMLAQDGRCKTFDATADGYVRSEGCGIVVMKKLSDAVKAGDRIYSVIKGSSINQDGKSNGLTAPNGPSQEEVIKNALKDAEVKPNEINYLETHGTGTPLGDPIEVNSLTRVLTKDRSEENICYIGSVKTNIGHLEAAAGIAGVIKTSLALYHKEIPKNLNYKKLNPEILLDGKPVKIADKNINWTGRNRIAGVSSFGFGGTNAHIILQEAPEFKINSSAKAKPFNIFKLSAKNENVLIELTKNYIKFLSSNINLKFEDICYTANKGRASHNHRLAIVCSSVDELKAELKNFTEGKNSQLAFSSTAKLNHYPKTVFLFPGQGAQFIGMGKELYDTHPFFRNIINNCDEILRNFLDKPLLEVLFYEKDEKLNPINETTYTQPALFAIEYALAKLWMSWGIKPSVMMGHSAGEYVAACLAGVFSLEDGLKLVTERGRLMQTLTNEGEMYTVFADESKVKDYINGFENSVSVASINSPEKTVISGDKNSLTKIISRIDSDNIEFKKINVSIASHSPLMNAMINEFRTVCNEIKYSSPEIPVVSNITGEIVTDKISNANYWCEHILSTVRFSEGLKACVNYGCEFFIDLGPKPTSISMAQETIHDANIHWLPSIKYNFSVWETMLRGLAELYVNGTEADWNNLDKDFIHKVISLPSYPFQKQRYWIEDLNIDKKNSNLNFSSGNNADSHPLLGSKLNTASLGEFIFNSQLSAGNTKYLSDHQVFGKIIFPGAAYIEIALAAFSEINKHNVVDISDIKFHQTMTLDNDDKRNIQTILTKTGENNYEFKIYSIDDESSWTLHSSGCLNYDRNDEMNSLKIGKMKKDSKENLSIVAFYDNIKKTGVEYKKYFQAIEELYLNNKSALSKITLSNEMSLEKYFIHPVLLDASFQTSLALLVKENNDRAFIPVGIDNIKVTGKAGREIWSHAKLNTENKNLKLHSVDIEIFSETGDLITVISNLKLKEVSKEEFAAESENLNDWFYEVVWEEQKYIEQVNPQTIIDFVDSKLPELIKENNLSKYKEGIDELEKLSVQYIINAFADLGLDFKNTKAFTGEQLSNELNISVKHKKLFLRFLDILCENKIFKKLKDTFEITGNWGSKNVSKEIDLLKNKYPEVDAELTLLSRCGEKLSQVLIGKADPLNLLFPNGNISDVTKLYKSSPGFIVMNESVKNAVLNIINNFPEDRPIKILETGAGTGSTTTYLLPILQKQKCEYIFTDISPVFFNSANEEFRDCKNIEFNILDIEKDPLTQSFNEFEFDIIIASNVIHATRDLSCSLNNIHKLLNKNGVIILNEVTEKFNWIDLTFGLTDGWWRFEDKKLRADYPLLSSAQWKSFLQNEGFKSSEVSSPGNDKFSYTGQSTIVTSDFSDYTDSIDLNNLLIFNDGNIPEELIRHLKSEKSSFVLIDNGGGYDKISDNHYAINYSDKNNFSQLFKELSKSIKEKTDVVYISSGNKLNEDFKTEKLSEEICLYFLNTFQCVLENSFFKTNSLSIITHCSQAVTPQDNISGLSESPLWGIGKVISMEHPELNCKLIDIDESVIWKNILDEINNHSKESIVAFRENKKYVSRLNRFNFNQRKNFTVDENATYLITGGLGGLGILTAKFLADKGATHIALIGRRVNAKEADEYLIELKLQNVDVKIYKTDVTDKAELDNILKEIQKSGFPLKGIVHSVGVLEDGVLRNQTKEKFGKVMRPKVSGAWNLHELTKKMNLDFFVMYSSVASLLGSAGQANHSAANAFLDELAHYRRKNNLPALSINWGVWSETGSAAAIGADQKEKIAGIGTINPQQGIRALEIAMKLNASQIGIVPIDWTKFAETNNSAFINKLISKTEKIKSVDEKKSESENFIEHLKNSPEEYHTELLIKYFQDLISRIMGLEPEDFDAEQPLNTMGLDSLMAIELKNKVNIELGVDLNLVRYMEETNILQLAEELKEQLPKIFSIKKNEPSGVNGKAEITEEEKARELIANLENMSDEELNKLLNETK